MGKKVVLCLFVIEALENFSRSMKLPLRFSEVGIDDSRLEEMARRCVSLHGGTVGGLEQLGWEEIAEIYRMAR